MLKSKPELLPVLKNLRQIAVSMRTPSIPLPLPTFDTARKLAAAIGRAQRRLDSLTSAESTWGRIVVVDLKFEPMHLPGQQAKPDSNKLITSPIPMSAFRKNKDGSCVVGKESKQRWDLRFKWEQKGGCCLEIGALCRLQDGVQPKKTRRIHDWTGHGRRQSRRGAQGAGRYRAWDRQLDQGGRWRLRRQCESCQNTSSSAVWLAVCANGSRHYTRELISYFKNSALVASGQLRSGRSASPDIG